MLKSKRQILDVRLATMYLIHPNDVRSKAKYMWRGTQKKHVLFLFVLYHHFISNECVMPTGHLKVLSTL